MPQKGLPVVVVLFTTMPMANHLSLKAWLETSGMSAAELARQCEYDPSNLSKLLRGKVRPSIKVAARIEQITGGAVPIAGWAK
jgi:transcriptional regulator with XRE-family HTH domain